MEEATKEARLLTSNKQLWVHTIDAVNKPSEIASIVAVTRESASVAAITKVYTNPAWRSQRCAERLVRKVTQSLLRTKESVILYVAHNNPAASKVYNRVGFAGLEKFLPAVDGVDSWLELGFDRNVIELGHCTATGAGRPSPLDTDSDTSRPCYPARSISAAQSLISDTADSLLYEIQDFDEPGHFDVVQQPTLSRHGTLLSVNAAPARNAAELKSILGGAGARLKPGAAVLPNPGRPADGVDRTSLEQAKPKARVEVDIVLDRKTYVQGGYLQGHVKVRIHPASNRGGAPVMISGGKVRLIGFESLSNDQDRYPFYQCSSPLSTVTATSGGLYVSNPDEEGFALAIEGDYTLPFSMYLPMSADYGIPKGAVQLQSGVVVRYVAMVSIKVKDSISESRSIAHFYRNCEIWPRLNPTTIFSPAERPLLATAMKGVFMGGSGKVDLTASVHRLHWIAGQQCFVKVNVDNGSKKTIKSLALALIRSTVVFKPDHSLDAFGDADPDACQTSTTEKVVAESVLQMGQRGTLGHASAKGWWTGVLPGEQLEFSHSILLPPDELSVTRSRLLEVNYFVRATMRAGKLRTTDVQTSLPIRIVNFLSVDPPPTFTLPGATSDQATMQHLHELANARPAKPYIRPSPNYPPRSRGPSGLYRSNSTALESLEADEEHLPSPDEHLRRHPSQNESLAPEDAYEGDTPDSDFSDSGEHDPYTNDIDEELQGLTIYEDDADEIIPQTIQADPEYAPRFADLYHASIQDGLCESAAQGARENGGHKILQHTVASFPGSFGLPQQRSQPHPGDEIDLQLQPNSRPPTSLARPVRPQGPSTFAQRVQRKMEASGLQPSISLGDASLPSSARDIPSIGQQLVSVDSSNAMYHDEPSHFAQPQEPVQPSQVLVTNRDPTYYRIQPAAPVLRPALPPVPERYPPPLLSKSRAGCSDVTSSSGARYTLPKPPSMGPSQGTILGSGRTTSSTSSYTAPYTTLPLPPSISQHADSSHDTGMAQCYLSQQHPGTRHQDPGDECFLEAVPSHDSHFGGAGLRPSMMALRGNSEGSSSSVKDRVRELEERQKWLEENGLQ
ncbi:hypothetical protein DXG03_008492 [Asterophora parasitica]|uniref:Arrestin C-terminal-like domain-containing protein n=1 Tax=Asterophora parasitica TaxID=117018 RepID=A0A9P7GC33_9AGAR|nr:hypothetical protein DXG03_008492 [Asterophora parasitica]